MRTIVIESQKDFEMLGVYGMIDSGVSNIQIIIKNDIEFSNSFFPISLSCYNVNVIGNGKTLSNLKISQNSCNTGLFSSVNMIRVSNLNFDDCYISGGVRSAIIVGECKNDAIFNNVKIKNSIVQGKAYVGGFVGRAENINVENCDASLMLSAHDIVGGFAGLCSKKYNEINSSSSAILKSVGRCVGSSVGYCDNISIKKEEEKGTKVDKNPIRRYSL